MTQEEARGLASLYDIPLGQDFRALDSDTVGRLVGAEGAPVMNTAATVKPLCEESGVVAYSLAHGYASFMDGTRNRFPVASIGGGQWSSAGRVVRFVATYSDNSALEYTWSPSRGGTLEISESCS